MNYWNNKSSRNDNSREDKPPFSRIFIVCDKTLQEADLKPEFEKFGNIEDLYMPAYNNASALTRVAFIKYSKTSSAANAIQEMHLKRIKDNTKPLKVMIATHKSDKSQNISEDRYTRLFIKVSKEETQQDIREHFENFGNVNSVFIMKDKVTDESKGFAYVNYNNFVDAANAFENCEKKYRAIFAMSRDELKRGRNSFENNHGGSTGSLRQTDDSDITSLISTEPQSYDSILVTCRPLVPQKYIEDLFNIIPGMTQCQYTVERSKGICRAIITYQEKKAATYAVEKLHNFEFPSGELVSVKPNVNPLAKAANNLADIINTFKNGIDAANPNLTMLADAIAHASNLIKVAATSKSEIKDQSLNFNCNVDLPPPAPMASAESEMAKRLFIVCKPQPPPHSILINIFCRFGNLISVSTFPNKTFGFVKYACVKSAEEAIRVLHGSLIAGVNLKVMEAIDKQGNDESMNIDEQADSEEPDSRKRKKLENS